MDCYPESEVRYASQRWPKLTMILPMSFDFSQVALKMLLL
jgi:hypothetical protein